MHPAADHSALRAIEMTDASAGYRSDPGKAAVEHIDWVVEAGDYWAVAGLLGTGKTDFLAMAAGLTPPLAGHYHLFGEPMPIFEEPRLAARLRLGVVFDGGQLFHRLTVAQNVALPIRYHQDLSEGEAAPRIEPWLEAIELTKLATKIPEAIGRNWSKRVGLARALTLHPEVLLLDNPLGGLDPQHTAWWLAFLDQLAAGHPLLGGKPLTLVVTTADFRPWKGHARRFAMLRDRRFHILGSWASVESASQELARDHMPVDARS